MRVLGIDTATASASVGLIQNDAVIAEVTQSATRNHVVSLLGLVETVLTRAGCTLNEVDAIAVSAGPGSFSGLRVGLSVAKGLVYASGLRLVAVPTLEALARTAVGHQGSICVVLDARKGELYAACFESTATGMNRLTTDMLVTPESLLASLPTPCTVLGDAVERYGEFLQSRLGNQVRLLPFATYAPRGSIIAALGRERLLSGFADAVAELEPFYIRRCDAERNSG